MAVQTPGLPEARIAELDQHGYVALPGFLADDEVRALREHFSELLAECPTGDNSFVGYRTKRLHGVLGRTRAVDHLAAHPVVLAAAEHVVGQCLLSASVAIEIGPGEAAQTPHFDDGIYPLPSDHGEVWVSAHWNLDPYTEANGGTVWYPGTNGDRGAAEHLPPGVNVELPAGSLVIYVGTLWHNGGANRTDRPRLGLVFSYTSSWLRPQETQLLVVPPDVARGLNPELQGLLGYAIRPPFLGYAFGKDPRELLEAETSSSAQGAR
ncbi:MAG: phytanoyl-CoA dioxygenase family protein [Acidimicrobiales bacterium]|nr:phytanoyl-CoA dioxygenase family protein [Acidimicrobiales bacterium]